MSISLDFPGNGTTDFDSIARINGKLIPAYPTTNTEKQVLTIGANGGALAWEDKPSGTPLYEHVINMSFLLPHDRFDGVSGDDVTITFEIRYIDATYSVSTDRNDLINKLNYYKNTARVTSAKVQPNGIELNHNTFLSITWLTNASNGIYPEGLCTVTNITPVVVRSIPVGKYITINSHTCTLMNP